MKSGRLGVGSTTANTLKLFYQVPDDAKRAAVNINMCNRSASAAKVRVAISQAAAPIDDDYVEYDYPIPGNRPLERTGFMVSPGERVYVWSDSSAVSVRIQGAEA